MAANEKGRARPMEIMLLTARTRATSILLLP